MELVAGSSYVNRGTLIFLAMIRSQGLSYKKGKGRVRGNLKHVHWLCMAICVVRKYPGMRSERDVFQQLLHFFPSRFQSCRFQRQLA